MVTRKKRTTASRPPGQALDHQSNFLILGDYIITAVLILLTTMIAEASQGNARASISALADIDFSSETLFIALIIVMLMILAPLSQLLGGSIYNPCDAATLFTLHKCSFKSFLVRSVAQVAGALSGAIIVLRFFPETASERGKALVAATTKDIDSIGGASSEFLLTYLVSLLVMATQRSSRSRFIKYWAPLVATAAALRLGARYSGPVLNPAAALSWTWFYWNQQPLTILQHVFVFWVAPIAGAVAATLTDMGMQVANSTAQKPKKTTRKTD